MTITTTFLIDCIKHELKQLRLERELATAEDGDP